MTKYGAFSDTGEAFSTLETAVDALYSLPWMDGRTVRAISMVTETDAEGIHAKVVSGTARPDDADTLVYIVHVAHEVGGAVMDIKYLVEFGVDSGENAGHEDDGGFESRVEEAFEGVDGGSEQGGEVVGDVPPAGSEPDDEETD